MPELITLDFSDDWQSLERAKTCEQFEQQVMPAYLARQRWFASKGTEINRAKLISQFVLPSRGGNWILATFRSHLADGRSEDYFIPLAAVWDQQGSALTSVDPNEIIAQISTGTQSGTLRDAMAEPRFVENLVQAIGEQMVLRVGGSSLRFSHTHAYFPLQEEDKSDIRKLGAEQSNSSILIAKKMVLKAYRKLESGIQPELEMGRYLTEVADYRNTPPLLGSIEQFDGEGQPTALAVMQGFVPNQGDGWSFTLKHLKGQFNGILREELGGSRNHSYIGLMERLGVRIGELQVAFAIDSPDPAFKPEPISAEDVNTRKQEILSEANNTFNLLANSEGMLPPEQQSRVRALRDQRDQIVSLISSFSLDPGSMLMKTRFHGDLHLGQVLVAGNDFYIIDFEGEPARPFAQRRSKQSPLKDVAGMLRSINYAAWSSLLESCAGETDKIARLEAPALEWAQAASDALMHGYKNAAQTCSSFPSNPETFRQLLGVFVLEKALYEIRYELANRPSWIRIPVEGIMSLLEKG